MPQLASPASPATQLRPPATAKPSLQASAFPLRALHAATLRELSAFRQGDYPPITLRPLPEGFVLGESESEARHGEV